MHFVRRTQCKKFALNLNTNQHCNVNVSPATSGDKHFIRYQAVTHGNNSDQVTDNWNFVVMRESELGTGRYGISSTCSFFFPLLFPSFLFLSWLHFLLPAFRSFSPYAFQSVFFLCSLLLQFLYFFPSFRFHYFLVSFWESRYLSQYSD